MAPSSHFAHAFRTVTQLLPAAGVECLLIGGFAVNYYGYTRNTLDIDFMIAAPDLETVRKIMVGAGFVNISLHDVVTFFNQPGTPLRVDFLQVDADTMNRLLAGAQTVTFHEFLLKVPCLKDLIAMKLFAIRHGQGKRDAKDLPDVAYLTLLNGLDLERDLRPLCERYASPAVYEELCQLTHQLSAR